MLVSILMLDLSNVGASPISTQPIELASSQTGYSTQTDQRNYLDVADQLVHVEIKQISPNQTHMDYTDTSSVWNVDKLPI